jgi:hypothetical protein
MDAMTTRYAIRGALEIGGAACPCPRASLCRLSVAIRPAAAPNNELQHQVNLEGSMSNP